MCFCGESVNRGGRKSPLKSGSVMGKPRLRATSRADGEDVDSRQGGCVEDGRRRVPFQALKCHVVRPALQCREQEIFHFIGSRIDGG